jgi:sugar/nucleoside kinase (ribokinase family)
MIAGGETNVDKIADLFFELGARHLAIKLGSDGCYVRNSVADKGIILPSYKVENPVDTTGAGDSFCSGLLYGLSHDMPLTECVRIGNAVGAHCVMAVGASTGIKSYGDIRKFIEERQEK